MKKKRRKADVSKACHAVVKACYILAQKMDEEQPYDALLDVIRNLRGDLIDTREALRKHQTQFAQLSVVVQNMLNEKGRHPAG